MEEARMANAETLKLTNRVDDKVDKVDGKVDKVDDKVDKVGDQVDKVDDKVDKVDVKVDNVDNKVAVLLDGAQTILFWLVTHSWRWIWLDMKEANERFAIAADEEKRS